ncbi:MAG: hypothetical protein J6X66_07530 [Lachnospiraceae bacterium]|nr:hypothetical protein [Lachnospiraceae bacterium]
MSMIILDARRIKAYEYLKILGEAAGKEEEFLEELWGELYTDDELMGEFMYYLDHHSLFGAIECSGYSLTDLYFYLMRLYELGQDIGKNYADCNKETLVLDCFHMMSQMKKDPAPYIRKLERGLGMDRVI